MRLIDADAIPEVSWDQKEEAAFRATINKMPTIEAEPVRRGKWTRYYHSHREDDFSINCNLCLRPVVWPSLYCPQCGARMEEQE